MSENNGYSAREISIYLDGESLFEKHKQKVKRSACLTERGERGSFN